MPGRITTIGSLEKFAVGTGPDEYKQLVSALIDQEPVSAKMAFATLSEFAGERVIPVMRWEWFSRLQQGDGLKKACRIPPGSLAALVVFFEVLFVNDLAH